MKKMAKEEIKALRINLGLTQEQFARLVGCTMAEVGRWERGEHSPKGLYLDALVDLRNELEKRGTK
jgi:DNA-binding transcriptional regulator YiaG